MYDDYSGQIWIGSQELRKMDTSHLRSQVSVLDQDCVLFSGTIFENICHGIVGKDFSDSLRLALCQRAAADAGVDFLGALPEGIHTRIDNSLQLSGGQRQRICLARALVKKPNILILDEPTSALDAQSEKVVMHAVHKAVSRGTTVVMITHRLSTVLEADRVAVIASGRIVEEGTPSQLSNENSIFKGLLDAQKACTLPGNSDLSPSNQFESLDSREDIAEKRNPAIRADNNPIIAEIKARDIVSDFYRFAKGDRVIIAGGVLASIISGSVVLGEAVVFGNLVSLLNAGSNRQNFQQNANLLCLIFFILACIALLSHICSGTAFGIASARLTTKVQGALLRHVLHLDIEWFSGVGRSPAQLTSSFSKDASDLSCLSGVALGTIFSVVTSVLGGIVLAHAVAWRIAVVLLAAVPIMLASGYVRLRMLAQLETRQRTAYTTGTALALEACRNRRTVTMLGLEQTFMKEFCDSLHKSSHDGIQFRVFCNTLLAFSLAVTYFVYALAYWWCVHLDRDSEA
jgi:ABC-type multidrug transport system fused ATPase/permease subunit